MFIKSLNQFSLVSLLISSVVILNSCGLKVSEEKPTEKPFVIESTSCLDSAIDDLKLMFKGNAKDEQVAPAVDCIAETVKSFSTNIQGNNKGYFTADDITYFLNKNFIKSQKQIKIDLIQEIMKIKVSLVGGIDTKLEKSELNKLFEIINTLKPELVTINQHMKVITNNADFKRLSFEEKTQKFDSAKAATIKFAYQLTSQFISNKLTSYPIDSLMDLGIQFMLLSEADQSEIIQFEKHRKLVKIVKTNLVNRGSNILNSDWKLIGKALSETLFLVLRDKYFTKNYNADFNLPAENTMSKSSFLMNDIALAVGDILAMQNDRSLTYKEMIPVFNIVFETFNLDIVFTENSLRSIDDIKNALSDKPAKKVAGDFWTQDDFYQLHNNIDVFFHDVGIVTSILKSMKDDPSWKTDYSQFEKFEVSALTSLNRLSLIFKGSLDLKIIRPLLINLEEARIIKNLDFLPDYDKYFTSIVASKNLLTSTNDTVIPARQLSAVLKFAGTVYLHFLDYKNYLKDFKLDTRDFNINALRLLPKLKKTLNEVLPTNRLKYLSSESIIKTYRIIATDFELKELLTDESFKIVLDLMWSNILVNPSNQQITPYILPGLTPEAVTNLASYLKLFLTGNYLTIDLFKLSTTYTQQELLNQLDLKLLSTANKTEILMLNEMKRMNQDAFPLTFENKYLKILDINSGVFNQQTLESSNLSRLIARLLIRSFSPEKTNLNLLDDPIEYINSSVQLPELEVLFTKARSVLIELDFVAKENLKFMSKRFIETDLFVPHANGNDKAEFIEIHDIAMHLMSGIARAKPVRDAVVEHCLNPANGPFDRYTEVYGDCLIDSYYTNDIGFSFLPEYLKLKTILAKDVYDTHVMNLIIAAGQVENDRKMITFENMDNFPHIVQFVEMMYAKFDFNKDGIIAKEEALAAFPVFKSTIKKVVDKSGNNIKDENLPGAFIYFLKNGKGPTTVVEKLRFLGFIKDESKWIITTGRVDLAKVFKFLASSN